MKAVYIQGTRNVAGCNLRRESSVITKNYLNKQINKQKETMPLRISNSNRERQDSITDSSSSFSAFRSRPTLRLPSQPIHTLRSQARGLGEKDPDLPSTLCCVILDELLAILSPHAWIQAGRSLEYATLQSHLLPSSQNEA